MINKAKFKPTGHRRPVHRPREYEQAEGGLELAFVRFMQDFEEDSWFREHFGYYSALDSIDGLEFSLDDINTMLSGYGGDYKDENDPYKLGVFISACYSKLPDTEITFNLDLETEYLGYMLPEDKVLIIDTEASSKSIGGCSKSISGGPTGAVVNRAFDNNDRTVSFSKDVRLVNYGCGYSGFHLESDGILVNYNDFIGYSQNNGVIINFGSIEYMSSGCGIKPNRPAHQKENTLCRGIFINYGKGGLDTNYGITVNCGEVEGYSSLFKVDNILLNLNELDSDFVRSRVRDDSLFLDKQECNEMPELVEYFDALRASFEPGKDDYRAALAAISALGDNPRFTLQRDILKIIRGHGHYVYGLDA